MKIGNRKSEIANPSAAHKPSPVTLSRRSCAKADRHLLAFTLIELLVVIAIIAILASLIFPITGALDKKKKITLAQAQLKALEMAVDGYKTKLGFYPPDNTNNPAINPLYFELLGTTNDGAGKPAPTTWVTMDNSAQITTTATENINSVFSLQGFANTSTRAHADDQGAAATTFLSHLLPNQVGLYDSANSQIKLLAFPVAWPSDKLPPPVPKNPALTPWCYLSTHPTNNTSTYDLWVDVIIRGKTNRVCNWSTQPIQL